MNYLNSAFLRGFFLGFGRRPLFGGSKSAFSAEYGYTAVGPIRPIDFIPLALSCFFTVSGNLKSRLPSSTAVNPLTSIVSISVIIAHFLKIILVMGELLNKCYPVLKNILIIFPEMGYFLLINCLRSGIIKV
jgi:hypothetical protein